MKQYIFIIISILFCYTSQGQTNEDIAMKKALLLWQNHKTDQSCMLFERISNNNTTNWLAPYYISLINITQVLDNSKTINSDIKLNTAKKNIHLAYLRNPDISEILCIEALLYTAELASDPMNKGRQLVPKIITKYKKAIFIDNKNPRAVCLLAEFNIQSSKYTGNNTRKYYSELKKSIILFDIFEKKEKYSPTWGKLRTMKILDTKNE